MGKQASRVRHSAKKRWIKGLVLVIGVADCAGLYYAQQRLSTPVPDAVRYDMASITVPESRNAFHVEQPMLAEADRAAAPVMPVGHDAVPAVAQAAAAPHVVPVVQPAASQAAAAKLAVAEAPLAAPVRIASAPVLAAKTAPAHRATASAPVLAGERVAARSPAPLQAAVPHKAATSLATLVPKARRHSEFSRAFAALDVPNDAPQQLELALPSIEPARVAAPPADFAATSPVLETPLPAAPAELPPVSAAAELPEAKL